MEGAMIATNGHWGLQSLSWVPGRRAAAQPRSLEIVLEENETWSFEVGRPGVEVVCLSGEVWVTVEGDPEDHVLAAGATFSTRRKGRLAMMALRPARLGLRSADRPTLVTSITRQSKAA
jgi:hypothetical protein